MGESSKASAKALDNQFGNNSAREGNGGDEGSPPLKLGKATKGAGGCKTQTLKEQPGSPMKPRIKTMEWDPTNEMYRIEFYDAWKEEVNQNLNGKPGKCSDSNTGKERECYVKFSEKPLQANPKSNTHVNKANLEWVCMYCGPASIFTSQENVMSHVLGKHMDDISRTIADLGECIYCRTPASQIKSIPIHAMDCYCGSHNKAETTQTPSTSIGSAVTGDKCREFNVMRKVPAMRLKEEFCISTRQEANQFEAARPKAVDGTPDKIYKVDLFGFEYPPHGIVVEIIYFGLRWPSSPLRIGFMREYGKMIEQLNDGPPDALELEIHSVIMFICCVLGDWKDYEAKYLSSSG